MKKPHKLTIILLLPWLTAIPWTQGLAQESGTDEEPVNILRQKIKTASQAQGPEATLTPTGAGAEDLSDVLSSLKNPFIPQLPRPGQAFEPEEAREPQSQPTPLPRPADRTALRPQETDVPPPVFTINGLVWNTPRPQAIVDNLVRNVGDYIGQWKITEIGKEGIRVKYQTFEYLIEPKQTFEYAIEQKRSAP